MSLAPSAVIALLVSLTVAACLDAPRMSVAGSDPSGGISGVSRENDGMVLVPSVTFEAGMEPARVAPQDNNKDKDEDDKKGKGGGGNGGGGGGTGGTGGVDAGGVDAGGVDAGGGAGGDPPAPTTQLSVPAFWLDVREVTAASYRECLRASACSAPAGAPGCTLAYGLLSEPVNCVTIEQARAFCTWSRKRLVRSDEWTAAAAGAARRPYPWGIEPPSADRLNACGNECAPAGMYAGRDGHVGIAPGGSYPLGRTPDGVDDLGGNVAEWVDSPVVSIVRGASYEDTDVSLASSTHLRLTGAAGPSVGFRCASDH